MVVCLQARTLPPDSKRAVSAFTGDTKIFLLGAPIFVAMRLARST